MDYESLLQAGSMMGSGGLIVMDENACMVDMARFFLDFTRDESCGKCTPCRIGTKRMLEILDRITAGEGHEGDIDALLTLAHHIKSTSLCGLGQSAPNPVLSMLKQFRSEYEAHIHAKRCPAGVCQALLNFNIIPEKCRGCGLCARVCPTAAIKGKPKELYRIERQKCVKCGACLEKCPFGAVVRA
ncbi:MAG: NADP-reducing hydrogenase subunit HndC [Firmicutes bacterium]|nr:NADP-reducing hydrogenase subunit HndC [Bacillota bacterium]